MCVIVGFNASINAWNEGDSTSDSSKLLDTVIAGEQGSWRAGGQQEGLQYNGEAAG